MPSLRFLIACSFVGLLGACSFDSGNSNNLASTLPEAAGNGGNGGTRRSNVAGAKSAAPAGSAGNAATARGSSRSGKSTGGANDNAAAGEPRTDHGADGGSPPEDPTTRADTGPPESCELGGSCRSDCEDNAVTCGIESTGVACEFEGFTGATTEVACGRRAVIGTACCGGCGCVPVEVYFDGTYCWQGIPQCPGSDVLNRMLFPHLPTTPNPSYTPPGTTHGSFFLGNGGMGGGGGSAGGAGTSGDGGTSGSAGSAGISGSAGTSGTTDCDAGSVSL